MNPEDTLHAGTCPRASVSLMARPGLASWGGPNYFHRRVDRVNGIGYCRPMTATKLHITLIEDYEFEGECSSCNRSGLRWVATLSDGTKVGLECAKKILGYRPKTDVYAWINDFKLVGTHTEGTVTYGLWQHKLNPRATRETYNGHLNQVGGVRNDWERRGWISPLMAPEGA